MKSFMKRQRKNFIKLPLNYLQNLENKVQYYQFNKKKTMIETVNIIEKSQRAGNSGSLVLIRLC